MNKYFSPSLVLPIYTSRSCYNKCAFCTIPNATSGKYRYIEIKNVVKNIRKIQELYNVNYFFIVDETFDMSRMLELADELISGNIHIYWFCETRFTPNITFDNCMKLYRSGCRQSSF